MATKRIDDYLSIELDEVLGKGPLSLVYKGMYGSIPVAVKQIEYQSHIDAEKDLKESRQDRERKVMHLVEKDRHPHVIGYYYSKIDGKYMYLAMQLCNGDLSKYVKDDNLMTTYPPYKVNRDIAVAMDYLHERNIVHRDLKPENVYYVVRDNIIHRAVVGDFGFSKTTKENMFSFTAKFGTLGYIPYEVSIEINKNGDPQIRTYMTVKSDIFAMGCIFYYTVCRGRHPFGAMNRQTNIDRKNDPELQTLEAPQHNLRHLLVQMLNHQPEKRPTALDVLNHPAMWSPEKIMTFMKDASDDFKTFTRGDGNKRQYLESADIISRESWFKGLPPKMRKYLDEYRYPRTDRNPYKEYRGTVSGVLRIIRNITNHYRDFPVEVQDELGGYPDGHVQLWMKTCPHLFMHVFEKMTELRKPPEVTAGIGSELGHIITSEHTDTLVGVNPDIGGTNDEDTSSISQNLELLKTYDDNFDGNRRSADNEDLQIEDDSNTSFIIHNLAVLEADNQSSMPVARKTDPTRSVSTEEQTKDESDTSFIIHNLAVLEADNQSSMAVARKTDPTRSVSTEEQTKVVRQTTCRRHFSSDMWMRLAQKEIEEGKKTAVLDQTGQNYILCVDISESMSQNEAWSQTKQFVNNFISSLDSVKQLYDGVQLYLALVTFGHETKVVQRLTNKFEAVESAFGNLRLGGPTPMYGGLAISVATAGIPKRGKGNPHIILITDGRPTETILYAGGDQLNSKEDEEEAKSHIYKLLGDFRESLTFQIVRVGSPDSDFIQLMASVSGGTVYTHNDGQTILREVVSHERDMYYESPDMSSLPAIGSRVRRGLDWSHGDQDKNGPGTIIGHGREGLVVWVEWDAGGHQNCYQYGSSGQYDVLLTDDRREVSQTGTIFVGCGVTKEISGVSPSSTPEIGTVIKVLKGGKRVEVRWNEGTRGTYAFGENDLFEVWPYNHETTASPDAGLQQQARSTILPIPKIKNKNAFPQKPRR